MYCVSPAGRLCSVLLCGAHPTSNAGTRPDALPAAGPYGCGPSARDRQLAQLRTTKAALEAELSEYVKPDDAVDAGARLGDLLTAATHKWYSDFGAAHFNIDEVDKPQDRWIMMDWHPVSPATGIWILDRQGLYPMGHAHPGGYHWFDGEAEAYLDAEYAALASDFDEYWLEVRLQRVDRQLRAAQQELPAPEPHRPVRHPQRDAKPRSIPQQEVAQLFDAQEQWQTDLARVQWQDWGPLHALHSRPSSATIVFGGTLIFWSSARTWHPQLAWWLGGAPQYCPDGFVTRHGHFPGVGEPGQPLWVVGSSPGLILARVCLGDPVWTSMWDVLISEMDATTSGTPTSALAPTTAHSPQAIWARSQNSTWTAADECRHRFFPANNLDASVPHCIWGVSPWGAPGNTTPWASPIHMEELHRADFQTAPWCPP